MGGQARTLERVKALLDNYKDLTPMEFQELSMKLEILQAFVNMDKERGRSIV